MFWKESVCGGYRFQSGLVVFPVIVSVGMMVVFLAGGEVLIEVETPLLRREGALGSELELVSLVGKFVVGCVLLLEVYVVGLLLCWSV